MRLHKNNSAKYSIIWRIYIYGKYDELCSKIHYNFRSNLNLPGNLNEKYTANSHNTIHNISM